MTDHDLGASDEELFGPRSANWRWRAAIGLAGAIVIAAVAVGLTRHLDSRPSAARHSTMHSPVAAPSRASSSQPFDGVGQTFSVGRHGTPVTLYGSAVLLEPTSCEQPCSIRFAEPAAVEQAMRHNTPGCVPAFDDVVSRHTGSPVVQERRVACLGPQTTVVVNIARVHSPLPDQRRLAGGVLVSAARVYGPYTVQAFVQTNTGRDPDPAAARALASDRRLLAGLHASRTG